MKQPQHEGTNQSSLCQHNLHHASSNVQSRKYSSKAWNWEWIAEGATNSENPNSWNIVWQHHKVQMRRNLM